MVCQAALKKLRRGDLTALVPHPCEIPIYVSLGAPPEIASIGDRYEHVGRMFYVTVDGYDPHLVCAVIPTSEETEANMFSLTTCLAISQMWLRETPVQREEEIEEKMREMLVKAPCVVCTFMPSCVNIPREALPASAQVSTAFSAALFLEG